MMLSLWTASNVHGEEGTTALGDLIQKLVAAQRYDAVVDVCDVIQQKSSWTSEAFTGLALREAALALDEESRSAALDKEYATAMKLRQQANTLFQNSMERLRDAKAMYASAHPLDENESEAFDYQRELLALLVARAELTLAAREAVAKPSSDAKQRLKAVTEVITQSLPKIESWEPPDHLLGTEKERLAALGHYLAAYGAFHSGDADQAGKQILASVNLFDSPEGIRLYKTITGKVRETTARGPEFVPQPLVPLNTFALP